MSRKTGPFLCNLVGTIVKTEKRTFGQKIVSYLLTNEQKSAILFMKKEQAYGTHNHE